LRSSSDKSSDISSESDASCPSFRFSGCDELFSGVISSEASGLSSVFAVSLSSDFCSGGAVEERDKEEVLL
jgi:hypothetical protein